MTAIQGMCVCAVGCITGVGRPASTEGSGVGARVGQLGCEVGRTVGMDDGC